jgi:hypothetical protein
MSSRSQRLSFHKRAFADRNRKRRCCNLCFLPWHARFSPSQLKPKKEESEGRMRKSIRRRRLPVLPCLDNRRARGVLLPLNRCLFPGNPVEAGRGFFPGSFAFSTFSVLFLSSRASSCAGPVRYSRLH